MQPRRHSLRAKNLLNDSTHAIVFYDWGSEDAQQVVVCVHGLTRNAHDFDLLAQALAAQGKRVLALNMAGRGESDWLADPMGYNYAQYAADCLAVMDNFHLRGVEWIGTSMGGIIGMIIAAQQPNRIRKMVLNDIGTFLSKEALGRIYSYVGSMPQRFPNREAADAYLKDIFSAFGITDAGEWHRFVEHSLRMEGDTLRLACDPAIAVPLAVASNQFQDVADINLSDLWENIHIPTLILRGALSDVLDEPTVKAMRATNTRAETAVIAGVGHAPSLMNDVQITLVCQWLMRSGALPAGL